MKKKAISLIMCITLLFSLMIYAVPTVSATEKSVRILHNGEQISEISLESTAKETLTVETAGIDATAYQWQIQMDQETDTWVDVYGETQEEFVVSYAFVKNMLDEANCAYVRCEVTTDTVDLYSDKVCVQIILEENVTTAVHAEDENIEVEDNETDSFGERIVSFFASRSIQMYSDSEEYVTITVKYLDESSLTDGNPEVAIYSPYVATIEKNTDFSQTVISPTFLGFAPYYDGDNDGVINIDDPDDDASQIVLNLTGVTSNQEIKVYYMPIKVNYAIRYFFQNITDDFYLEDVDLYYTGQALTGTLMTDEELRANAGDTTGFQKLYHYPESVAADGSTVFECYYDRNYYLLQFDLDGGYGVDPVYGRYDEPFIVNQPVKTGYTFAGWELMQVDTDGDGDLDAVPSDFDTSLPSTIPAYNCYFKAKWIAQTNATATVVYWLQNAEPESDGTYGYSYWQAERLTGLTPGNEVYPSAYQDITQCSWYTAMTDAEKKECKHYTYNVDRTGTTPVEIKGDGATVINVYYDRKEYTLQFIFARSTETNPEDNYQIATLTNSDNYWDVSWNPGITRDEDAWTYVTGSTDPKCNSFKRDADGYVYYYFEIKDKYGARIDKEWGDINDLLALHPIATDKVYVSWRTNSASGYGSVRDNKNIKGAYPYMDDTVLIYKNSGYEETHQMTAYNNSSSSVYYYKYEIYFDDALYDDFIVNPTASFGDQSAFSYAGMEYIASKTKYYNDATAVESGVEKSASSYPDKPGNSATNPAIIQFYYESLDYTLEFYNYNTVITDMTETVQYGESLSAYKPSVEPSYPNELEPDAYVFGGWYTSPGCYDGTEVIWEYDMMPSQDIRLYAKWTPVKHTVNFFKTYDDMLAFEANTSSETYKTVTGIVHGNVVGETITNPTVLDSNSQMELVFAGWFYMEAGEKKAFTILDMPINRDMNVFADWSSTQPQPYRIQYVLKDQKTTKVADDTNGFAYGGTTRTFIAKAGNPFYQLYAAYNNGYFPTLGSHSITMQYEEDKTNPKVNVHTFEYVNATDISYTVKYVNKVTGKVVATQKNATTNSAVVTERFVAVSNMVPDAFYKRLVLSVVYDEENDKWIGSEDNVITFYYTPNTTSAYYAVHFMLEKLDSDSDNDGVLKYLIDGSGDFEEATTHVEGVGDVNSDVSIKPNVFSGFSLSTGKGVVNMDGITSEIDMNVDNTYTITIKASGTELYVFYTRNEYDYTINYYNYNSTTPVDSVNYGSVHGTAKYGSSITETAKTIPGYTCVSALTTQTMSIRDDSSQNVINFYYSPLKYTVEYVAVPAEGGRVSNTIEVITGGQELTGSVPTANTYYEFDGWYLDEACTIPVSAENGTVTGSTNQFLPIKGNLSETERNIFYAKFKRKVGNLTINRTGADGDGQIFVYEIRENGSTDAIYVTVTGNSSVTIHNLPQGEYIVTEQKNWSWRYPTGTLSQTITHETTAGTTVSFSSGTTKTQWLNGNSPLHKNIRGISK